MAFGLAVVLVLAFAFTNGFHDAANAVAALVATRVARPGPAILMASVANILGPLLLGAAVADTISGIVTAAPADELGVVGAALTGAVAWNILTWWRGLPSSSSHALIGGLVGAAIVTGGLDAVHWGGLDGLRPVGVLGVLLALVLSPVLGLLAGAAADRGVRSALRRATRRVDPPIRGGEWLMSATLAFSHGANDAGKAMGLLAFVLVAAGRATTLTPTSGMALLCGVALTLGTAMGGWRIVRTIGRRIYRIRPVDGLMSTSSSAAVILSSTLIGAPTSTTQVVSSSVVGVGVSRRRRRHVNWIVVREIGLAWIFTLPGSAIIAIAALPLWRLLT